METNETDHPTQVAARVRAVLDGNRDAYQELVVQWSDKVYAVAWSRLGVRHLAEEVVQETFIQGYQQLSRLREPEKFASWITRIARNKAINLGMRHRSELNKRQQWALEQDLYQEGDASDPTPDSQVGETLRESLSGLSDSYRECLTLFYLQGRSVASSAQALGITEGSFKTRLHRARHALRSEMETRLEEALRRLKPSEKTCHSIMVAVMAQAPAQVGVKSLATWIAGVPLLSWTLLLGQVLMMIPSFFLARWMIRQDLANFKDPLDARARLYQQQSKRTLLWVLGGMLLFAVILIRANPWQVWMVGGLCFLLTLVVYLVQYPILKYWWPRMAVWIFGAYLVFLYGVQYYHAPKTLGWLFVGWLQLTAASHLRHHPSRMDLSLFLRQACRIKRGDATLPEPSGSPATRSRGMLASFIDFLSRDLNLTFMRRDAKGFHLRLSAVDQVPWMALCGCMGWKQASRVFLGLDGRIEARLGAKDARQLEALGLLDGGASAIRDLEATTARHLQMAYAYWADGRPSMARMALGEDRDAEIFHVAPGRSVGHRLKWQLGQILGILLMGIGLWFHYLDAWREPLAVRTLQEVRLEEKALHSFLKTFPTQDPSSGNPQRAFRSMIHYGHLAPPTDWFDAPSLLRFQQAIEQEVAWSEVSALSPQQPEVAERKIIHLAERVNPVWAGFLDWENLYEPDWAAWIRAHPEKLLAFRSLHLGDEQELKLDLSAFRRRLQFLASRISLDGVDFSTVHQRLSSLQALQFDTGQATLTRKDFDRVQGLCLNWDRPFLATWECLKILELTHGLHRIDREACIRGILRNHLGGGRCFIQATHPRLQTWEAARETWRVFDSLRILGALDRVEDLAQWKFRVRPSSESDSEPTWNQLEAWLMQREFDAYLIEHGLTP